MLVNNKINLELTFQEFAQNIYDKTGIDLFSYKGEQLFRRVIFSMEKQGFDNLRDYYCYLNTDENKLNEFIDDITINLSEFFRDKDIFEQLKNKIFPILYKNSLSSYLKIWSAGCASGAEIYSVAIILDELGTLERSFLIGTDISNYILERAKKGIFKLEEVKNVSRKRLLKYFTKVDKFYSINDNIKRKVHFKKHDLLKNNYENICDLCDLILCRNVVIYFTDDMKKFVYQKFNKCLKKGGILFLGNTERILNPEEFGFKLISPYFYQKI